MEDSSNVLINSESNEENNDKDNGTNNTEPQPNEINTNQVQQLSDTTLITLEDEPSTESSTDPTSEDTTQNLNIPASSSQNPNQVPQTPPPDYTPSWRGVDAYRPRPGHSDRPPIPQGIPPPPYQGIQFGPAPTSTQQSISDEPPPEYPGPPRVFNPAAPVQYPPGSRLALALEQERRREIGRLIVLQAVLNACEERSERGGGHPARSNPEQPRSNRPQSAASLAKARRGKIYGIVIALVVMVVFFTIIGVIFYHHHHKKTDQTDYQIDYPADDQTDYIDYDNYIYATQKTTTKGPRSTCATLYCNHGGRCVDDNRAGPKCVCTSNYYGTHCQYRIWGHWGLKDKSTTSTPWLPNSRTCLNVICHNGGTCYKNSVLEFCICPRGYKGIYCQEYATTATHHYY